MKTAYLLTGKPGTGKTSLVRLAVAGLGDRAGGFYTEEIRSQGARLGFRLVTLGGREAVLSRVDMQSRYRVGRYGVDVEALERVGMAALREAIAGRDIVVIDEIGKMELLSPEFKKVVREAIASGKRVLGTIMLKAHPWADEIKKLPRVKLVELTRTNYYRIQEDMRKWLEEE